MTDAKAVRHFEDLVVGTTMQSRGYPVTREEVIEFAAKYDPQPFHLDDDAAAATYFGRLSASGWHTGAMTMRLMVEQFRDAAPMASLGSPGMDELRWLKPVYPGDTIRVESELLSKRRSRSNPGMGLIKSQYRVYNQDDVLVMTMIGNGMVAVRDPAAPFED